MGCIKCGRETEQDQLFCQRCMEVMEKHPVKPGTAVILPRRRETPVLKKSPRRRVLTAEEQLRRTRRRLRVTAVLLVITLALAGLLGWYAVTHLLEEKPALGQNYTFLIPGSGNTDTSGTP